MMMKTNGGFLFYGTLLLTVIGTYASGDATTPGQLRVTQETKAPDAIKKFSDTLRKNKRVVDGLTANQKDTAVEKILSVDEVFSKAEKLKIKQKDFDCDLVEKLLKITRAMFQHYNALMKMRDAMKKIKTQDSFYKWRKDPNSLFTDATYHACANRIKLRTQKIQQLLKAFIHFDGYKDDGAYVKTGVVVWEAMKFAVRIGIVVATGYTFGANPQATWDSANDAYAQADGFMHFRQTATRTINAFLPVVREVMPIVSNLMHDMNMHAPFDLPIKMDNKYFGMTICPHSGLKKLIDNLQQTQLRCRTNELNDQERIRLWKTTLFVQKVIMQEHTLPTKGLLIHPDTIANDHDYLYGGRVGRHRTYVKRFVFVAKPQAETIKGKDTEQKKQINEDTMKKAVTDYVFPHYIAMHANTNEVTLDNFIPGTKAKLLKAQSEHSDLDIGHELTIEKDYGDSVLVYREGGTYLKRWFKQRLKRYTIAKTDLESLDKSTYKANPIVGVVQLKSFKQVWIPTLTQLWHSCKSGKLKAFFKEFKGYDITIYNMELNGKHLATSKWQDVPIISQHIKDKVPECKPKDITGEEYMAALGNLKIRQKEDAGKFEEDIASQCDTTTIETSQEKKDFNYYNTKRKEFLKELCTHIGNWNTGTIRHNLMFNYYVGDKLIFDGKMFNDGDRIDSRPVEVRVVGFEKNGFVRIQEVSTQRKNTNQIFTIPRNVGLLTPIEKLPVGTRVTMSPKSLTRSETVSCIPVGKKEGAEEVELAKEHLFAYHTLPLRQSVGLKLKVEGREGMFLVKQITHTMAAIEDSNGNIEKIDRNKLIQMTSENPLPYQPLKVGVQARVMRETENRIVKLVTVVEIIKNRKITMVRCVDEDGIESLYKPYRLTPLQKYETLLNVHKIKDEYFKNVTDENWEATLEQWIHEILTVKVNGHVQNCAPELIDIVTSMINTYRPDFTDENPNNKNNELEYLAVSVAQLQFKMKVYAAIAKFGYNYKAKSGTSNMMGNSYMESFKTTYSHYWRVYETIKSKCFGDKPNLEALTNSFRPARKIVAAEWGFNSLIPRTVKEFFGELRGIASHEESRIRVATIEAKKVRQLNHGYEIGQVDPCDDTPAFLKLSPVCEKAKFLWPTLKPVEGDVYSLYRPGEKLLWQNDQINKGDKIAELEKTIKILLGKQINVAAENPLNSEVGATEDQRATQAGAMLMKLDKRVTMAERNIRALQKEKKKAVPPFRNPRRSNESMDREYRAHLRRNSLLPVREGAPGKKQLTALEKLASKDRGN